MTLSFDYKNIYNLVRSLMKYYRSTLKIVCKHNLLGVTVIEYLRNLQALILKYCQQQQQQQQQFICTELFFFVVKHGKPTDEELEMLGAKIGENWKKLGRRLEIGDETIQEMETSGIQLSEKGYCMLQHWKRAKGSTATYQILCDALQHKLVQRQDLAEKFCYINGNYFVKY